MKIELKNIKVNLSFSEETTMFKADLYINDKKVGYAENEGHGGPTNYDAIPEMATLKSNRKIIEQAEQYCKTLPAITADLGDGKTFTYEMNLENFIDDLLNKHLMEKENQRFMKTAMKATEKKIVFGNKENGEYKLLAWTDKRVTIAQRVATGVGRNSLILGLRKVYAALKEGETIWNENIPADVLAAASAKKGV